ncbi:glycosyltransferase family 2 protein [Primorskyibacter aestuariivivens]|uniref:glycosyltransferase family 2 protein n=1 Tax=Primorskyibacter aestuariivivens TaxID=1888912 RepID=UPI0023002981|nr:glycosyltransferase family 2 protein [Primorskyibacter aestuariivivens]MDA7428751.1 glycosyltransferase family 2 protein [Primorskyibacter aestuariivivens]
MSDPEQPPRKPTYDGGIKAVLTQMEARRDPLTLARGEALPPLDVDLDPLKTSLVPAPGDDPLRAAPLRSTNQRKHLEIRAELVGNTELTALHGLLIAHLRKRKQPAHCAALFARLWAEEADHLLSHLDARWLVSAITTFGDHGLTETQRSVGQAMNVLFGTIKLYETERRYCGMPADRPFPLKGKDHGPLPMEMDPFHIPAGGLDVNMLGRLWQEAERDKVLKPLAHHLLDLLIHDPRTVFRRLRIMRKRKERRDTMKAAERDTPEPAPAKLIVPVPDTPSRTPPRWGVVSTIDAPLTDIARFAAHYLTLGAARIDIYLDRPCPEALAFFGAEPRVHLTTCDADYWASTGKDRPEAHQLRQAYNATQSYRASDLDWLAHVDADEFLICPIPIARALRFAPDHAAQARMRPVEALADGSASPTHFKISHRQAGQKRRVLDTIYPNYGGYLTGGFISHTSGKVFARTGLDGVRFGIHGLKKDGASIENEASMPRMKLAHLHARSYEAFRARMEFRLERGSYRKPGEDDAMRLGDVLDFVLETEGETGLRHFFDEVCTDSPALRDRLAAHDMLFTHPLELDAQVAAIFGSRTPKAGAA